MTGHPHSCPRCGSPVAGTGKTGMCKPCASSLSVRRRMAWEAYRAEVFCRGRTNSKNHRSRAPVTLHVIKMGEER